MSVKITDNSTIVIANTQRNSSLFLRLVTEEIHRIANPKTPKDKGYLRGNVLKTVLGLRGTIVWKQKYASIQETKKFQNYTTAGTGKGYARTSVDAVAKNTVTLMKKARLI